MKLLLCGGMVAFACASTACVVGVDSQGQIVREEKRFSLEGTPEVHLGTFDGAISVDGADGKLSLETGDGGVNVEGDRESVV